MDDFAREHAAVLRSAFEAGCAKYGTLAVDASEFEQHVLRRTFARAGAPEHLGRALAQVHAADLYLAFACDCSLPSAWELLQKEYGYRLRGLAISQGASETEADELARGLPGELVRPPPNGDARTYLGRYDGAGSLWAWLARILSRRVADRRRDPRDRNGDSLMPDPPDNGPNDPSGAVVGAETGARVEEALRSAFLDLSTRESLIVMWKFRDDLKQSEIAERLGISAPRVSFLMERTLKRLRESVLARIDDESVAQWWSREHLWQLLRHIVGRLLDQR